MKSLTLDSPAKVNLMLSVHGPRGDGFHALTSLVVALEFGDTLKVTLNQDGLDRLVCQDPAVPTGAENLIMKAAAAFRCRLGEMLGADIGFDFDLDKRIPMGAGLGGGSSNAAVALRAMNQLTGEPLNLEILWELAAALGSDCPFFVEAAPAVMSGRGELLSPLSAEVASRLIGQRIVLFRPDFGVNTAWAYRSLAQAGPTVYEAEDLARARLEGWMCSGDVNELLYNTFEPTVGRKYLAIPSLLDHLRVKGHTCLMSGSGSCCFAFVTDAAEVEAIRAICQKDWGARTFFVETSIR